jgi:hypothetical protein
MSNLTKQLFEGLKSAKEIILEIAPGLNNIWSDIAETAKQKNDQARSEAANLLFTGHAFVPYGPGQHEPPTSEQKPEIEHEQPSHEMERDR